MDQGLNRKIDAYIAENKEQLLQATRTPKKEKPKQIKPLKHIGAKRQVKTHSIKFRLSIKKAAVQKAAFVFPQS